MKAILTVLFMMERTIIGEDNNDCVNCVNILFYIF